MHKLSKLMIVLAFICVRVSASHAQATILDQSLLTPASFSLFTPVNVTGPQTWYFSSSYGAVCTGYSAGQSYANEDWLVGPVMDLSQFDDVKLTFEHTRGNLQVMNAGVADGWYKVFATANYTGDPLTTQWTELSGLNQNVTTAWQYIPSGELIVPEAAKSANSRIAFRYISSATQSATWEIKNVKVTGESDGILTTAFKVTNWNTEWLGCATYGPTNENLQVQNVVSAMLAMDSDIFCIQEVTNNASTPTIQTLVSMLGSNEWGGSIAPSNTGDCDQRQGIIYKKSKVQLVNAMELNNGNAALGNSYYYNWSNGRFPSLYNVNIIAGSESIPVTIVNLHAKAEDGNAASYTRRMGGAIALKAILDTPNYNSKNVIVAGDFNDYLIGTTSNGCNCSVSPYSNFTDDEAQYLAITKNLTNAGASWGTPPLIEHIIISNELTDNYIGNSAAQELAVAQNIPSFGFTTSNHLPVSALFQFSTLSSPEYMQNSSRPWTIYPNPVKTELKISSSTTLMNPTEIYDLTGRKMSARNINTNTIDVSALPAGIYLVKIGDTSSKFVKQ